MLSDRHTPQRSISFPDPARPIHTARSSSARDWSTVNPATRASASRARNSCSRARPLGRCRVRAGHSLGPTGVRISTDGDARWCATVAFLNNRYQDPALGRFVSVDPLVNITRDAYGYANNNPVRYSDPWGLDPDDQGPCGGYSTSQACSKAVVGATNVAVASSGMAKPEDRNDYAKQVARPSQPSTP